MNTTISLIARQLLSAQSSDDLSLINDRIVKALAELEKQSASKAIEQNLIDAIYSTSHWFIRHKLFDRAEDLYMNVLAAQEDAYGENHPSCQLTIMKMMSLLRYEQKFSTSAYTSDLAFNVEDAVVLHAQAS
jgi:hypothetical protein